MPVKLRYFLSGECSSFSPALTLRPDCGEYYDGETWTGTVYPDRNNKNRDEFVAVSRTLDECRAKNSFRIMDAGWDNADHDCGLNCRRHQADLSGHPQFRKGGSLRQRMGCRPKPVRYSLPRTVQQMTRFNCMG